MSRIALGGLAFVSALAGCSADSTDDVLAMVTGMRQLIDSWATNPT